MRNPNRKLNLRLNMPGGYGNPHTATRSLETTVV